MEYNGPAHTGKIVVAATPAIEEVELGFEPGVIEIINQTTGAKIIWYNTMPADSCQFINATGPVVTFETSKGITIIEGVEGKANGFQLGILVDFADTATQILHFAAYRGAQLFPGT